MDKLTSCACCFSCFRNKRTNSIKDPNSLPTQQVEEPNPNPNPNPSSKPKLPDAIEKPKKAAGDGDSKNMDTDKVDTGEINAKHFTFRELASATKNFRHQYLLGEGGFGRVYKGTLKNGQVVAVKQLDRNGQQEQKEFLVEVLMVSLLHHENLVDLVGYCADGDQRLLVYEFVPGGSLDQYILDVGEDKTPLDWYTRIKIAYGAAQGLEYLHDKANPPVIYRDFKSSNILLDNDLNPKLSDFGLANLGSQGNNMPPASRIMGTYGYSAPEYTSTGQVTLKSDVFSYGVVLLEILTGRRAIDTTKPINDQNLVSWAQPFFKDPKKFPEMADPLLEGKFPERSLNQAVAIAAMCLQEEPTARPLMSDVVTALSFLSVKEPIPTPQPVPEPAPPADPAPQSSDSESSDNDKYKARQVTFSNGTSRKSSKKRSSTIRRSESSSSSDGSFSRYHSTKIDIDTSDSESELFDDESVMSGRISSRNSRTGSTSKRSNQSRHRDSEYDGSVQSG